MIHMGLREGCGGGDSSRLGAEVGKPEKEEAPGFVEKGECGQRPCVVLVTCFLDFTLNLEH